MAAQRFYGKYASCNTMFPCATKRQNRGLTPVSGLTAVVRCGEARFLLERAFFSDDRCLGALYDFAFRQHTRSSRSATTVWLDVLLFL